jgi:hypothetical protein
MSLNTSFDSPTRKPQKEQKNLVKLLMRTFSRQRKRTLDFLKWKLEVQGGQRRTSTLTNDKSMNMDLSRTTGALAGISGIYNYSMMYKGDGRSVQFDLNESSNLLDNSNFAFLQEDLDEPTRKRRGTGRGRGQGGDKEVDKSTYLTFDAQMSHQFKAR